MFYFSTECAKKANSKLQALLFECSHMQTMIAFSASSVHENCKSHFVVLVLIVGAVVVVVVVWVRVGIFLSRFCVNLLKSCMEYSTEKLLQRN